MAAESLPHLPAGLLCHMEDGCLSQPCHQEAQCSALMGTTLCLCQPGYTGPTCHQDLDECQMGEAPRLRSSLSPRTASALEIGKLFSELKI